SGESDRDVHPSLDLHPMPQVTVSADWDLASEPPGWSLWQCCEPPALGPTEPSPVDWESGVCAGGMAGGAPYDAYGGLQSLSGGPLPARDRPRAGRGLCLGVGHLQILT